MDDATANRTASQPLEDLRSLAGDQAGENAGRLRAGTDRLIIEAMRRIQGTPAARGAAVDAAHACRALAEGIQDCVDHHNAATREAVTEARVAALSAIDRLECQIATCPPPPDPSKPRRRAGLRSSSVVMKKRRGMGPGPTAKTAS